MEKITYFCDVCKKEVEGIDDLKTITIGDGNYTSYQTYGKYKVYKKYDLCIDCRKKLQIELPKNYTAPDVETIEKRLFNIVVEIIDMCK